MLIKRETRDNNHLFTFPLDKLVTLGALFFNQVNNIAAIVYSIESKVAHPQIKAPICTDINAQTINTAMRTEAPNLMGTINVFKVFNAINFERCKFHSAILCCATLKR